MPKAPAMLVVDDGELNDIVALLDQMGVEFAHLRGSAIPPQVTPPTRVIVTTARRAMLTKDWPRSSPYRIAVVTEDSNTLRAMLRRVGFDLLLRRPIHEVALRLVIVRALYAGEEKRREERVPIGLEISFRTTFRRKTALLADISQRGCRLLGDPLTAGSRFTLAVPKELASDGLSLPCKVVRVSARPDSEGRYEMGLAYENLSKEKAAEVRALMKRVSEAAGMDDPRVFGAKPAARPAAPTPPAAAKPAPPVAAKPALKPPIGLRPKLPPPRRLPPPPRVEAAGNPTDRRQHPRGAFPKQVARLDAEAESVLLGRDLSVGGMRVEYNENLQVGDVVELAVYASPREEPLMVKARVSHDTGDGLGLAFEGLDPNDAARFERLVARLPSVEALQGGESGGLGSVVSKVLSNFRRE
jgi:hypothetical protein